MLSYYNNTLILASSVYRIFYIAYHQALYHDINVYHNTDNIKVTARMYMKYHDDMNEMNFKYKLGKCSCINVLYTQIKT